MEFTLVSSLTTHHHHGTGIALESRICLALLLYNVIETSHFKLDETLFLTFSLWSPRRRHSERMRLLQPVLRPAQPVPVLDQRHSFQ